MSVQWGMVTSVVMPGGWHYVQNLSGGLTHKIIGFSFEQLLDNILEFRRRHIELCGSESASIEAVRSDLRTYLCTHFRQNCAGSHSVPHVGGIGIVNQGYHRPIDRAGNWLAEVSKHKNEFVDIGLAGQRAQICAQCPSNIRWETPCAPCNQNIEVRLQNFKGNLRTPYDSHLFMCRVFGHINQASIWMTDTQSTPAHEVPAHCWKISEHGN
jgi:hypothetical protein